MTRALEWQSHRCSVYRDTCRRIILRVNLRHWIPPLSWKLFRCYCCAFFEFSIRRMHCNILIKKIKKDELLTNTHMLNLNYTCTFYFFHSTVILYLPFFCANVNVKQNFIWMEKSALLCVIWSLTSNKLIYSWTFRSLKVVFIVSCPSIIRSLHKPGKKCLSFWK